MKALRKLLILSHRYLGIAVCLLVVMWFATGIAMIYAGGMPRLEPQTRLARLAPLDLTRVRLSPAQALEAALWGGAPPRTTLLTIMGRPAYRFSSGDGSATVYADTGDFVEGVTVAQASQIAASFAGVPPAQVRFVRTVEEPDQWTLLNRQLPLHKFAVDDGAGTEIYVSPDLGEVTLATTRRQRALAWVSTIPHWFYFTGLRTNQPLWYRLVVWTSGLACVAALLGLLLGVVQFRRTRPFRLSNAVPYAGWTRWHYVTGAIFGVFTATWAFSGMLSMEPFAWTNATGLQVSRGTFTGGDLDLSQYGGFDAAAWSPVTGGRPVKEIEFSRVQDAHYYVVHFASDSRPQAVPRERLHQPYGVNGRNDPDRLFVAAGTLEVRREPFSVDSLTRRLQAAHPDVPVVDRTLLTDYDAYYYSRARLTPLPVLRVRFADPAETWVYVDPETSQVVAQIHRLNRVERWLYNGLHSLDFSFWYTRRPLWDAGVILLCLGGLATSGIGLLLGVRRLRRAARRATVPLPAPQPAERPV